MTGKKWIVICIILATLATFAVVSVQALPNGARQSTLGSGFTYQGELAASGLTITDDCSMAFRLYDQAQDGAQVGSAITTTVPISNGLFTVNLDFGAHIFAGDARWLSIQVQCPGDSAYTAPELCNTALQLNMALQEVDTVHDQ